MWRRYCYLTSFSDCQYALVAKIWPNKVVRWCRDCEFLRPALSASRMQYISDLHSKFALRPHHGKKKKKKEETGQKYNVRVCLYITRTDVRKVRYTHFAVVFQVQKVREALFVLRYSDDKQRFRRANFTDACLHADIRQFITLFNRLHITLSNYAHAATFCD